MLLSPALDPQVTGYLLCGEAISGFGGCSLDLDSTGQGILSCFTATSDFQVYWFYPTPKEQIRQGLPAGDEGEEPGAGATSPRRDPEALPPGCSAGKVNAPAASSWSSFDFRF